jgi:ABC-type multidrug transport system fused ATPase/permease subunit
MAFSMAIASFIVGFTYSWKLSLVLLSVLPFLIFGACLMIITIRTYSIKNRKAYEEAGGIAEEVIYQIKTVASFANYDYEIGRFNQKLELSLISGLNGALKFGITIGIIFFLIFGSYTLAIWYGSTLIYKQEINSNTGKPFAAGDILTVLFTIVFGALSLAQAAPNIKAVTEAMNAAYDFFELKKRVPLIRDNGKEKPDKITIEGKIDFINVTFSYPSMPNKTILDCINLSIEPGKITAIVGPSGSGKSTIVNLIERLYEIKKGQIISDL